MQMPDYRDMETHTIDLTLSVSESCATWITVPWNYIHIQSNNNNYDNTTTNNNNNN